MTANKEYVRLQHMASAYAGVVSIVDVINNAGKAFKRIQLQERTESGEGSTFFLCTFSDENSDANAALLSEILLSPIRVEEFMYLVTKNVHGGNGTPELFIHNFYPIDDIRDAITNSVCSDLTRICSDIPETSDTDNPQIRDFYLLPPMYFSTVSSGKKCVDVTGDIRKIADGKEELSSETLNLYSGIVTGIQRALFRDAHASQAANTNDYAPATYVSRDGYTPVDQAQKHCLDAARSTLENLCSRHAKGEKNLGGIVMTGLVAVKFDGKVRMYFTPDTLAVPYTTTHHSNYIPHPEKWTILRQCILKTVKEEGKFADNMEIIHRLREFKNRYENPLSTDQSALLSGADWWYRLVPSMGIPQNLLSLPLLWTQWTLDRGNYDMLVVASNTKMISDEWNLRDEGHVKRIVDGLNRIVDEGHDLIVARLSSEEEFTVADARKVPDLLQFIVQPEEGDNYSIEACIGELRSKGLIRRVAPIALPPLAPRLAPRASPFSTISSISTPDIPWAGGVVRGADSAAPAATVRESPSLFSRVSAHLGFGSAPAPAPTPAPASRPRESPFGGSLGPARVSPTLRDAEVASDFLASQEARDIRISAAIAESTKLYDEANAEYVRALRSGRGGPAVAVALDAREEAQRLMAAAYEEARVNEANSHGARELEAIDRRRLDEARSKELRRTINEAREEEMRKKAIIEEEEARVKQDRIARENAARDSRQSRRVWERQIQDVEALASANAASAAAIQGASRRDGPALERGIQRLAAAANLVSSLPTSDNASLASGSRTSPGMRAAMLAADLTDIQQVNNRVDSRLSPGGVPTARTGGRGQNPEFIEGGARPMDKPPTFGYDRSAFSDSWSSRRDGQSGQSGQRPNQDPRSVPTLERPRSGGLDRPAAPARPAARNDHVEPRLNEPGNRRPEAPRRGDSQFGIGRHDDGEQRNQPSRVSADRGDFTGSRLPPARSGYGPRDPRPDPPAESSRSSPKRFLGNILNGARNAMRVAGRVVGNAVDFGDDHVDYDV